MSAAVAEELYALSQEHKYDRFSDLLADIDHKTTLNTRQLDILIKLDFFSDFGNQNELAMVMEMYYDMFKRGASKQIQRTKVDGTLIEDIVKKYSVGETKSGGVAKSYTLLDVKSVMREIEDLIMRSDIPDRSDQEKVRNFSDVMGYAGYISGREEDRRKLFITEIKPLVRKKDKKQFGYSIFTKSIGSGKESRFTLMNRVFKEKPIKEGDIIFCKSYERDNGYYTLLNYSIEPKAEDECGPSLVNFISRDTNKQAEQLKDMAIIKVQGVRFFDGHTNETKLFLDDTVPLDESFDDKKG